MEASTALVHLVTKEKRVTVSINITFERKVHTNSFIGLIKNKKLKLDNFMCC